mgnify:FL=1
MIPKGGFEMKTSRTLISSAMLTAMCDTNSVDNLKLLEKFVAMCIAETTDVGSLIDKDKVLKYMDESYSFHDMPMPVLEKILQRMSQGSERSIATSTSNNYKLIRNLDAELATFKLQEHTAQVETHDIIVALTDWLRKVSPKMKADEDTVSIWLGDFFDARGVDVLFDIDELRADTIKNTDALNYQIGRFILEAKETDDILFAKIEDIARGAMIASAIYIDTSNTPAFVKERRLTNLSVYLDTAFVLSALNYKRADQKKAADTLLDMLRENGASLFIFPQHKDEIVDILRNFRDRDAYDAKPSQPLERLEAERFTTIEIDQEIQSLTFSLKSLGIADAPRESYLDEIGALKKNPATYIDYSGLSDHVLKKIPRYSRSDKMLQNDIDAISYIVLQRDGMRYETIESCQSIFLTTNYSLVREANQFLRYSAYKMQISPIISDIDLTSILWIKYAMQNRNIPRLWLISAANAAVSPTASVMGKFYEITVRMSKKGDLTDDEAANLRYSTYARAEIMSACGGNPDMLDDTSVLAVRDRVKAKYTEKEAVATAAAKADAERAKHDRDMASQKLISSQSEIKRSIGALRKTAREVADDRAKKIAGWIKSGIIIALVVIMIATAAATVIVGIGSSPGILTFVVALISGFSAATLWLPLMKVGAWVENRLFNKIEGTIYIKELARITPQVQVLEALLKDNSSVA